MDDSLFDSICRTNGVNTTFLSCPMSEESRSHSTNHNGTSSEEELSPIGEAGDVCASTDACETLIRLEVSPEPGCVLSSVDGSVEVIQHSFQIDECEVVLRRMDGNGSSILKGGTIDVAVCPLLVMEDFGVVPSVTDVTDDGFVVDGYAPHEGVVWPLIEELRGMSTDLTIREIMAADEVPARTEQHQTDIDELTDKQREALELAYAEGYFERPRRTNQAELADELGISKQALSCRLARAEEALFGQLLAD